MTRNNKKLVMKKIGFIILMAVLFCTAVAGEGLIAGLSAIACAIMGAKKIISCGYGKSEI